MQSTMANWVTLLVLLVLTPAAAVAQGPYYVGLRQTFGHDSNVFRLPDQDRSGGGGPQSSGLISTTVLLAGIDLPIGRQRLYGDLTAGYARYGRQPRLDHPTHRVVAGLDWDTLAKASGNLQLSSGRRLGAYGSRDVPAGDGDNEERYDRIALLARLGDALRSRAWLQADVVWDRLRNEVSYLEHVPVTTVPPLRAADGYRRNDAASSLGLGVRYRWQGTTIVGAGLRTESRSLDVDQRLTNPTETLSSSIDSRRNDIDFFLGRQAGDLHDLSLRLSYGVTSYRNAAASDIGDWNGSLRWIWRPSGKLVSKLRLLYDSEDRELGAISPADAGNARQSSALEWQLDYAATAKISARAVAKQYRREYGVVPNASYTTDDRTLSLGLHWAVWRSTTLGCDVTTDRRSSTLQTMPGSNSYQATVLSCFVQLLLR
jgi:hypothetical protein